MYLFLGRKIRFLFFTKITICSGFSIFLFLTSGEPDQGLCKGRLSSHCSSTVISHQWPHTLFVFFCVALLHFFLPARCSFPRVPPVCPQSGASAGGDVPQDVLRDVHAAVPEGSRELSCQSTFAVLNS